MKNLMMLVAAIVLGATLHIGDAEAKRLGGGSSSGMQRQSVAPSRTHEATPAQAPHQAAAPSPMNQAGAAAAQPKRSWMGPLAGLAAGIGLAALASHFGFGEELASLLMMGLLAVGVLMVVGYFMRKKAGAQPGGPRTAYAGGVPNYGAQNNAEYQPVQPNSAYTAQSSGGSSVGGGRVPADFDADGFVRNAKVMFIRLQAANDARNLDDIREFTAPEMFAEIKMGFAERGDAAQETDVQQLDARVLDVAEEGANYVVSVLFNGQIREEKNGPVVAFEEMWHLVKPRDNSRGWVLAGIQQLS